MEDPPGGQAPADPLFRRFRQGDPAAIARAAEQAARIVRLHARRIPAEERADVVQQVMTEVRTYFREAVYQAMIPRSVRLGEAPSFGKPILTYDIRSKGAEAYLELAREVMGHEAQSTREGALRSDSRA